MNTKLRIALAMTGALALSGCGKDSTYIPANSSGGGTVAAQGSTVTTTCGNGTFAGGTGAVASPYLISTPCQLENLDGNPSLWNMAFKLTNNIDMTGIVFSPNIDNFTGVFDGAGFAIRNWNSTAPFFVTSTGVIKNLTLSNMTVQFEGITRGGLLTGTNDRGGVIQKCAVTGTFSMPSAPAPATFVGGLAGINRGSISNSSVNASITGGDAVGGAVGYNYGSMTAVSSAGTVTGINATASNGTGGLVGFNQATISNSYSSATVVGTIVTGGLVGQNSACTSGCVSSIGSASIDSSYSVGAVSGNSSLAGYAIGGLLASNGTSGVSVTNSYWDTQNSSLASSAAGTGKTTAQMKTQATFSGWDFVSTWSITASAYPALR